jgi:hypothetical protein
MTDKTRRPLDQVMEAVLKLVPEDFDKKSSLEAECDKIIEDMADFDENDQAIVNSFWYRFAYFVERYLGEPDTKWKEEVADVMTGKKDYLEVLNA